MFYLGNADGERHENPGMKTRCSSIVIIISCPTKTPVDSLSNIQNNDDIILELSGACERSGRQLDHGPIGSQEQVSSFKFQVLLPLLRDYLQ